VHARRHFNYGVGRCVKEIFIINKLIIGYHFEDVQRQWLAEVPPASYFTTPDTSVPPAS
jgi:hypothetical protein